MNKYYILKVASGTKETGPEYPQVKVIKNYDWDSPSGISALSKTKMEENFPDFEPILDCFQLMSRSKLTDILSQGALYYPFLLISPKLKNILANHKLVDHRFYPAKVKSKELYYDYFVMQIKSDLTEFVDWPKTSFVITDIIDKIEDVKLNSKEEWLNKKKEIQAYKNTHILKSEKICLLNNFDKGFDLFYITTKTLFDGNIYISSKLKSALNENHITGLEIKEGQVTV